MFEIVELEIGEVRECYMPTMYANAIPYRWHKFLESKFQPKSPRPKTILFDNDHIEFRESGDEIVTRTKKDIVFYGSIKSCTIWYYSFLAIYARKKVVKKVVDEALYSWIEIESESGTRKHYFDAHPKVIVDICDVLYRQDFKFAEFMNGQRVFKGKIPSYKTVQEIKKKYNVEW